MNNNSVYELIRLAFFGMEPSFNDDMKLVYDEFYAHGIASLMSDVFNKLPLDDLLKSQWMSHIVRQIYIFMNIVSEQEKLNELMDSESIPFVIIKGTAAAQYYQTPINRSMGDIDILVKPQDFSKACDLFDKSEFKLLSEITPYERHARYEKNGVIYELHYFFASMNDAHAAQALDEILIKGIDKRVVIEVEGKKFPALPDFENGLVLLQHINQHLENGLGLRQIIDWMMYVICYLDDNNWKEFEPVVERIGLKELAITLTKMCQIYLGLPSMVTWCDNADKQLCSTLMDYIMQRSNMINGKIDDTSYLIGLFSKRLSVIAWFKLLQSNGKQHWKLAKYPVFRPFAWLYQIIRYIVKGISRDNALSAIKYEYKQSRMRTKLFERLGVKCKAKGLAFRDGSKFVIRKTDNNNKK
ncbi:MAG: nucleotidyltransferase family protein [Eubacteriales bacterium]|nr:nucleotidyltransferase family protein [Eubacteriales bacterium]